MGKEHRLGPLHMGIAGQDHILVLFRRLQKGFFQSDELVRQTAHLSFHVHMEVQSALVVPAPGGVEPCACISDIVGEALFHVHMDIFQFHGEGELSIIDFLLDFGKAFCDFLTVFF